ncbi:MAG: pyridoxal 5'-phosphate synthase glutaminase subunit PdxT [Acidobacteriaceae bacterium]|nr:pyridoxal 5'-phosphate synthase glutaminase subunit PdxT [Acidobacteriaceae bacterium]
MAGKTVGVLALQGDYERHLRALESAGAHPVEVRTAAELAAVDALVLPGGESTTMLKLLHREGLFEPLAAFGREKPIFGTCAGAILLATTVTSPEQESLGLVDIAVQRNAYGRQLDSRVVTLPSALGDLEAVFIRAPIIRAAGPAVNVLATYNDDPVLVEQGRHLVATFHPELTVDPRVHAYFLTKL